jgi:endonuclease/exonuclease/phosphatase family metal-dependent hydrolase
MNILKTILFAGFIMHVFAFNAFAEPAKANESSTTKLRIIAYNVACGQWASPERIAEELKSFKPDIVLLSEVPIAKRGKKVKDWSQRMADALGLPHVQVGNSSSAGHKDPDLSGDYNGKYKSILSRTPLSKAKNILPQGSGWARASALRVETEIAGRKFALYSLHLPGYAHHRKQPSKIEAWQGSKQKGLADEINSEDPSFDIIVGGDFNEWTDGLVMKSFAESTQLKNSVMPHSIDHILYSTKRPITLLDVKRDWGPKNQNDKNLKSEGCLSDHPWIYCEFEIPVATASKSPKK